MSGSLMMTDEELALRRLQAQQQPQLWDPNNPIGTELLAPPRQELRAGPPAPPPPTSWGSVPGQVWSDIKTGAGAIGGLLTADIVTPTARSFALPGVDLPADAKIEHWDSGPMVRLADGRLIDPSELPKRGAVIPRQIDPATKETSWAVPGLLDLLPALGSETGLARPVAEGVVLGAGARGGKAAAKAAGGAPEAARVAESVPVATPAAKAPRKPPAEMQGPPWRPLGAPPEPTPGANIELPPLSEGLLYDPEKGTLAGKGATLGMSSEEYDAFISGRAGLLDAGVAKLIRPVVEKGRAGTMASTPSLRAMTVDDALATARSEPHIIPKPDGGYVGAPHNIRTPDDLKAARDRFDASVAGGAGGADWYLRVKRYAEELSARDPIAGRQLAEELALFSAQSDPFTNLGFAQQARNAWVRGEPSPRVRTGQQAERFNSARAAQAEAIEKGLPFPNMQEGNKTGIFRQHMDISALMGTTGTNDIWHARAFGFRDPKTGKPWDKALSDANHSWLDYETMLAVDRANAKKLGGRSDWTPAEIQAAPWVAEKAKSLEKRFKIPPEEAFNRASSTYPDYAPHYTADAPFEQAPGGNTGLTTGTMTPAEWQAASRRVDPGNLDPTFRQLGMNQREVVSGTGGWKEEGTPVQHNPVDVARPMIDWQGSGAQRQLHPGTQAGLEAVAAQRGLTDMQIGTPITMWDTRAGSNARNAIRIDLGRGVTDAEARQLYALSERHGLGFANTGTGAGLLNFSEPGDALFKGTAVEKRLKKGGLEAEIQAIVPGAKVQRAATSGPYVDYGARLAKENQGQGLATRMLDEKLQAAEQAGAPGMVHSLLDDPNEAVKAQQNLQRLMASGQLGVRPDYERYLRLLAETRLRGLMEHARRVGYRGLPAAAGGAGLGGGLLGGASSSEPGL